MSEVGHTQFTVAADEVGRLDAVLCRRFPAIGRRRWARAIADGSVEVDGRMAKKGHRVTAGTQVAVRSMPAVGLALAPVAEPDSELAILHEDPRIVVVDKPAGVASHPLVAGESGTLANALVARYPECAAAALEAREGGLAHRLDRGTSGVLICARDREAWTALRTAFRQGAVHKSYLALVAGRASNGSSEASLVPRGRRTVIAHLDQPGALDARTEWTVLDRSDHCSLLRARAESGRMHQIRAHLADAGYPLIGDPLYRGPATVLAGSHAIPVAMPFLHAESISFPHPDGQEVTVQTPLPGDRAALVARLGLSIDRASRSPISAG